MAYKVSNSNIITNSNVATFKRVIVGVHEDFAPPPFMSGSTSGYATGGEGSPSSPYDKSNVIDKFSLASDANATDVGDLSEARISATGQSSDANGYTSGGTTSPPYLNPPSIDTIDKFPFSSDANATDVGNLTQARKDLSGQSSGTHGYSSGGQTPPSTVHNTIDKFSFSSDGNATDVGDLTQTRMSSAGQSSPSHGFTSGGYAPSIPGRTNVIDRFAFASDANATDYGDTLTAKSNSAGNSSASNGYTSGGTNPIMNVIEKFPFASSANATDVGDLTASKTKPTGQNSSSSGYVSGGNNFSSKIDVIDKFPFASDANATDVGDLTHIREALAGQQV